MLSKHFLTIFFGYHWYFDVKKYISLKFFIIGTTQDFND